MLMLKPGFVRPIAIIQRQLRIFSQQRDVKMKRGVRLPAFNQDSENQNPNLFTSPSNPLKPMKATIKSSKEKKKIADDTFQNNKVPSLRSNLSTKNAFTGRPILNQITEFCNELKKLATRARESENEKSLSPTKSEQVVEKAPAPSPVQALRESDGRERKEVIA